MHHCVTEVGSGVLTRLGLELFEGNHSFSEKAHVIFAE